MNRISKAFQALRSQGFIARQSFMCCGSCAGAELSNRVEHYSDDIRGKCKGCVFYTQQQAAAARDGADQIYLSYGPLHTDKAGTVGLSAEEVGRAVAGALHEAGVTFEWNGDGGQSIVVDCASAFAEAPRPVPQEIAYLRPDGTWHRCTVASPAAREKKIEKLLEKGAIDIRFRDAEGC